MTYDVSKGDYSLIDFLDILFQGKKIHVIILVIISTEIRIT